MNTHPSASTKPSRGRAIALIYSLGAALLLWGVLFGKRDARDINRIPKPVRMLTSALVLACALLLRREEQRARRGGQAGLVAAGMGSGFLGDLIMAEVIPLPEHVLGGMLAFGVGHACYIRAFLVIRQGTRRHAKMRFFFAPLGAAWLIAILGWWALVRNLKLGPALNYGALAYGLLLSSMSGLAAALAFADRRYTPVAAGGTLFLVSDMILASELFRNTHFPQIGDVVWLAYIGGQALIVWGMANENRETEEPKNQ